MFKDLQKRIDIRFQKAVSLSGAKNGERILDLGSGEKKLLNYLPGSISYLGLDLIDGYDLEKELPDNLGKFDIIFMLEFIEHIENFRSLMKWCKELLSDKGRIIISTPSNNRILYSDIRNTISEDLGHIHCFRKSNIRNLAAAADLRVTRIIGTYLLFPPLFKYQIVFCSDQTLYTQHMIYRLEKNNFI